MIYVVEWSNYCYSFRVGEGRQEDVLSLSLSVTTVCSLWDLSALARNQTQALGCESMEV